MSNVDNYAIGWDDDIYADEPEYKLLDDGDYDFTVESFERTMYGGSEKLPECMKISVTFVCTNGVDTGKVIENFYLAKKSEWRIGAFLTSVGLKTKNEATKPSKIGQSIGLTGRCKVTTRKWTGNDGNEKSSNSIREFYPKAANPMAGFTPVPAGAATPPRQFVQAQPQPTYQQPYAQPQQPYQQTFVAPNPAMWQGK